MKIARLSQQITAKKYDLLCKFFGFISQNTFCHCHHLEYSISQKLWVVKSFSDMQTSSAWYFCSAKVILLPPFAVILYSPCVSSNARSAYHVRRTYHAPVHRTRRKANITEKSTSVNRCAFFWLGHRDSNPGNVRVRVWCLTAWRCPTTDCIIADWFLFVKYFF